MIAINNTILWYNLSKSFNPSNHGSNNTPFKVNKSRNVYSVHCLKPLIITSRHIYLSITIFSLYFYTYEKNNTLSLLGANTSICTNQGRFPIY